MGCRSAWLAAGFGITLLVSPVGAQPQTVAPPISASWQPDQSPLPKTKAGDCVAAYISSFNSGEEAIRAFELQWRAAAALVERPLEARVEGYRDLKKKWGALKAHCVVDEGGDERLGVLIQTSPGSQWLACEFQFESPGKLRAIVIDGPIGQEEIRQRLEPIDDETRDQTIKAAIHALNSSYVFPDMARQMDAAITAHAAAGKYAGITSAPRFAQVLTDDLRAVCHDKHLRVRLAPSGDGPGNQAPRNPAADADQNYGFEKAEVLQGNIGYIKFNGFSASDEARKAAAAAMAVVADCDAVIFDVRGNGGGSPRMVEFLGGYLYDEPTVLNVFFDRKGKKVSQTKTLAAVPGKKLGSKVPVYVLTSGRTFSCAEEFSYDLQTTKRGVIVGETTGGGAHPVMGRPLGDRFMIMVPFERAENPITKKNWEGTGVEPDIRVPAAEALEAACKDARRRLSERQP